MMSRRVSWFFILPESFPSSWNFVHHVGEIGQWRIFSFYIEMSSKQIYKTSFSLGPYFDIISKLYKVRGIVQAIFLSPSPRLINYLYFASLALSFSLYRGSWRHRVLLPRFYGVCPKNKDISYIAIMQWSKSGNLILKHSYCYVINIFQNIFY